MYLRLENVKKSFKNKEVVKNLNLEVAKGEFLVLVGPSGCGKTTTLRMIAGLEEVSSGKIYLDGREITDLPPKDRDVAMVFQSYALYPHKNVFENIAFGLRIRKLPEREIRAKVEKTAAMLGLSDLLDRKPRELSGGQRQRVALGRAIVREPKLFLMDEPLSNLDAKLRVQMRAEIKKLQQDLGITVIYVTHDQVEAMTMGDRIAVFYEGELRQVDRPEEIYQKPVDTFVATFIGSPSMNLLPGVWDNERKIFRGEGFEVQLNLNLLSGEYILGIRPNQIKLGPDLPLKAFVAFSEYLGSEHYHHVLLGQQRLTVVTTESGYTGQEIKLAFPEKAVHFFAKDTGRRVEVSYGS
ncbi:ABC transporter ATP-binding protein [Carboxydothermus ferrireducens]|uniref:Multiple sugar transport system ATP-binding protein n=1 Tax=Carboxydothermus ferrireducens DSM 11255 TaxID=1119529 RepID=A0ABX2R9C7_9THEO|nr:sn-glycerol-3-phosphate ABC transporter ATP-binding protein UgpC [Carboxydothermus ferrireducens]NYE57782.1 multiple sugar transport system ATP-binding protein [Carboxydothermus ferrireducens DSM 11255]